MFICNNVFLRQILGIHHGVNDAFALLDFYVAYIVNVSKRL